MGTVLSGVGGRGEDTRITHLICSDAFHLNRIPLKEKKFCPFKHHQKRFHRGNKSESCSLTRGRALRQNTGKPSAVLPAGLCQPRRIHPQGAADSAGALQNRTAPSSLCAPAPSSPGPHHCPPLSRTPRGCSESKSSPCAPSTSNIVKGKKSRRHAWELVRDQPLQPSSWPPSS